MGFAETTQSVAIVLQNNFQASSKLGKPRNDSNCTPVFGDVRIQKTGTRDRKIALSRLAIINNLFGEQLWNS